MHYNPVHIQTTHQTHLIYLIYSYIGQKFIIIIIIMLYYT